MTLQEKYLPLYHFSSKHSISVNADQKQIFALFDTLDFRPSIVIRILFFLRGLSSSMLSLKGMGATRFKMMEEVDQKEFIIGLIGRFWKPSGDLQDFDPSKFIDFQVPNFCKATWSFRLIPDPRHTHVETETRIYCTDPSSQKRFSRYWFFIKPFSGLIRMEILRLIKKQAEAETHGVIG